MAHLYFEAERGSDCFDLIDLTAGAHLAARAIHAEGSLSKALRANAASFDVADLVIRDLSEADDDVLILATDGSTATVARASIAGYNGGAIHVRRSRTAIADVAVRGGRGAARVPPLAVALESSPVNVDRLIIEATAGQGLALNAATATISDLVLSGSEVLGGLAIARQSVATLRRAEITAAIPYAIHVVGAKLALEDVHITGRAGASDQDGVVADTSSIVGRRVRLFAMAGPALYVGRTSTVRLEDVIVDEVGRSALDTSGRLEADGLSIRRVAGRGINLREQAEARVSRAFISDVFATVAEPGVGARITNGASLHLSDSVIRGAAGVAVLLEYEPKLVDVGPAAELARVELSRSVVGLRVTSPRSTPAVLALDEVRLIDNETDTED
jgi:hypothetical protein